MSGDSGAAALSRGGSDDADTSRAQSAKRLLANAPVHLRRGLIWLPALIPALVYVLYVNHYAVNVPFSDDWSRVGLVSDAIHGHLTWSELWAQHSDARLVLPNLIFVLVGIVQHWNLRTVMLASAVVYCVTFGVLLRLTRAYIGKPLTVLPVVALGAVWFSLADWGNSLWPFQIAWFLVLLFFAIAIYFLNVWAGNRSLGYGLALLAAVAGSLSMLQGFLIWPVALICIAWRSTSARRRAVELSVWIGAGLVTTAFYLRGYERGVGCFPRRSDCSIGHLAHHPAEFSGFSLALIGNFVPKLVNMGPHYIGVHQLLGAALCIASAFVVAGSIREWNSKSRPPIALVVVVFALLFELSLAVGRAGEGVPAALTNYRFIMPSTVLVAGIGIYVWAHHPMRIASTTRPRWYGAVTVLVVLFVASAAYYNTTYGLTKGRIFHKVEVTDARTVVNLRLIEKDRRACLVGTYAFNSVYSGESALNHLRQPARVARADHLSVFARDSLAKYRALGPPASAICAGGRRVPPAPK